MSNQQHRPILTSLNRFKKAFLEDFVKRYNIPLPAITRKSHTKPELIDAIRADQKQFRYLPRQSYRQLLKTVQKYNIPFANKDRYVKQDFINAIKAYTQPKELEEVDIKRIRRFKNNFRNWELIPRFYEDDLIQFFDFYKQLIE